MRKKIYKYFLVVENQKPNGWGNFFPWVYKFEHKNDMREFIESLDSKTQIWKVF
jgi:hypothetical protein